MGRNAPSLSLGIEEEYLLVDPASGELVSSPDERFIPDCKAALGDQVTRELLQAQVEVGTAVCRDVAAARAELHRLRRTVADTAARPRHGPRRRLHPSHRRPGPIRRAPSGSATRRSPRTSRPWPGARWSAACTSTAEIEDEELRIDLMNQVGYFLPHLLALSTSSPFWSGQDTGLKAFRRTVAQDLPRSGTAERLAGWREWQDSGRDADRGRADRGRDPASGGTSAPRPSTRRWSCGSPTSAPSVEDALTIAALFQSLLAPPLAPAHPQPELAPLSPHPDRGEQMARPALGRGGRARRLRRRPPASRCASWSRS